MTSIVDYAKINKIISEIEEEFGSANLAVSNQVSQLSASQSIDLRDSLAKGPQNFMESQELGVSVIVD